MHEISIIKFEIINAKFIMSLKTGQFIEISHVHNNNVRTNCWWVWTCNQRTIYVGLGRSHHGVEEGADRNESLGQGAGRHPEPLIQRLLPNHKGNGNLLNLSHHWPHFLLRCNICWQIRTYLKGKTWIIDLNTFDQLIFLNSQNLKVRKVGHMLLKKKWNAFIPDLGFGHAGRHTQSGDIRRKRIQYSSHQPPHSVWHVRKCHPCKTYFQRFKS
jgi:hypothetical protein